MHSELDEVQQQVEITNQKARISIITLQTIALALVLFGIGWLLMPFLTFFTVDTGIRFLQIRELIDNGWQSLAISYPGRAVDPEFQFVPFYYAYSLIDEHIFFQISPFFPLAASFLYVWWGKAGLVVLPVLGGVATAVAVYKLARLSQLRHPYWIFWGAVFSTPILFYSLTLWDHTIGTACALWAVYGVAKGAQEKRRAPLFWAGLIMGVGLGQRPELYVFAIALGMGAVVAVWPTWKRLLPFIVGGVFSTLLIWWLQYQWVGHPLGMAVAPHLFGYGRPDQYPVSSFGMSPLTRIGLFLINLKAGDVIGFSATLFILVGIIMVVWVLRIPKWQLPRLLLAGFIIILLGYLLLLASSWQKPIIGIVSTFSLIPFSLTIIGKTQTQQPNRLVYNFILVIAFVFTTIVIFVWRILGGEHQWGVRYLLPLYPLLLYLAFYVYTVFQARFDEVMRKQLRIVMIGLFATSILVQVVGVRFLYQTRQANRQEFEFVASLPADIVITNHPFLPADMSGAEGKSFFYVADINGLDIVIPRLFEQGVTRIAILPLSPYESFGQFEHIQLTEISPMVYQLSER